MVRGRHGLWPSWFVAVMVCGHHGLWPSWFVAVMVCGRYGLWPSWFVAIMVCGRHGLWLSWFVAIMVCGHHCRTPAFTIVCPKWAAERQRYFGDSIYITDVFQDYESLVEFLISLGHLSPHICSTWRARHDNNNKLIVCFVGNYQHCVWSRRSSGSRDSWTWDCRRLSRHSVRRLYHVHSSF